MFTSENINKGATLFFLYFGLAYLFNGILSMLLGNIIPQIPYLFTFLDLLLTLIIATTLLRNITSLKYPLQIATVATLLFLAWFLYQYLQFGIGKIEVAVLLPDLMRLLFFFLISYSLLNIKFRSK